MTHKLCPDNKVCPWQCAGKKCKREIFSAPAPVAERGELVEKVATAIAKSEGVSLHLMHNEQEKAKYTRSAEAAIAALTAQPRKSHLCSDCNQMLDEWGDCENCKIHGMPAQPGVVISREHLNEFLENAYALQEHESDHVKFAEQALSREAGKTALGGTFIKGGTPFNGESQ